MEPINNFIKLTQTKTKTTERAEAIKFFVDRLRNQKGKAFSARRIAVKLAHLKVADIYYMQSIFKDIQNRRGFESAQKWFWWSLKNK